jgi:hypothetical protein
MCLTKDNLYDLQEQTSFWCIFALQRSETMEFITYIAFNFHL